MSLGIKAHETLQAMKHLSQEEKLYVIKTLVADEDISLAAVIYSELNRLETYRNKARGDIQKLATAGIGLGEKQIKQIPKIKSPNKRALAAAMTKTLLSTNVYKGTQFEKELKEGINFSEIDKDWYEQCWELESVDDKSEESS